jgi:hypothetical protein
MSAFQKYTYILVKFYFSISKIRAIYYTADDEIIMVASFVSFCFTQANLQIPRQWQLGTRHEEPKGQR